LRLGHFKGILRDILNSTIQIKKSDKLLILCGDDVIIKRNFYFEKLILFNLKQN